MQTHELKKEIYTVHQVANLMGVPYIRVYRWINRGIIKGINVYAEDAKRKLFIILAKDILDFYARYPEGAKSVRKRHPKRNAQASVGS